MLNVRIKYLSKEIDKIKKIEGKKSDWYDLRCAKEISLKEGQTALIPLGVAMELPDGYEAHILPRSSTEKNFGIVQTNSMGVVDNLYCGDNDEWMMPVKATRDTTIQVNDRICQFRIAEVQPDFEFQVVGSLGNPDRNGIGSTGTN